MAKKKPITHKEAEQKLKDNPINEFTCCGETMKHGDFKDHLFRVHKINPVSMKGKRSMLMHMDGDYWYSYKWQWELESGLRFTQYTEQVRADDDMMRFND